MRGRVSLRRRGERDATASAAGLGDEIRITEASGAELALGLHRSVAADALRGQEQIQQSAGSTQQQEREWGHAAGGRCEPARPGYAAADPGPAAMPMQSVKLVPCNLACRRSALSCTASHSEAPVR